MGGGGKGSSAPSVGAIPEGPDSPETPTGDPNDTPEAKKAADDMEAQEKLAKGRASTIKTKKTLLADEEATPDATKKKTLLGE